MLKGFKDFILRGNVVDLAIAVVIGTAFTALVKAFVTDILTPIVAAVVGKPNFGALTFTINHSEFLYGDIINAIITFVAVAAAIYFLVVAPLNTLAARRAARVSVPVAELPPDVALLTEIRDLLASQNGNGPTSSSTPDALS